jgi:hypothetical protein
VDGGLYLIGDVTGRQRREFDKKGGGRRYNITLTILTPDGLFRPERWSDAPSPTDVPRIGEHVKIKVNLVHFRTARGDGVRLTWGSDPAGENF